MSVGCCLSFQDTAEKVDRPGSFVASSKGAFEETNPEKQDVSKEAATGELKAIAQEGERGSSADSAKEIARKEGQQASMEYADTVLFAAAGVNVPSRPPPLSISTQVSHSPALHSTQPSYLIPSLRMMNPQYGLQQNIHILSSTNSPSVLSSPFVSGGELELPQARNKRDEIREAGTASSVAGGTKNNQEDTSMPTLKNALVPSMGDVVVENGEVQAQQKISESNEGGKGIDSSTYGASNGMESPNRMDREVATRDASMRRTLDAQSDGFNDPKGNTHSNKDRAVDADSAKGELMVNTSDRDLVNENKAIHKSSNVSFEIASANAKATMPVIGTNSTTPITTVGSNPTIPIASASASTSPHVATSTNTTSASDTSTLEARIGATTGSGTGTGAGAGAGVGVAIPTSRDSTSPTDQQIPPYNLDNEIDDVVELLDPLSSFSITPSGPVSPEHPGSSLPGEGMNMDPLNDIEDEEFARNELDNASSDKQKRIPKNGGGGTVFCNCNVDIHTINNYSSNSNMSEVGYYLRSILKELREFEKLMATNSALEERLSNVEKTLSALLHREDKD